LTETVKEARGKEEEVKKHLCEVYVSYTLVLYGLYAGVNKQLV